MGKELDDEMEQVSGVGYDFRFCSPNVDYVYMNALLRPCRFLVGIFR